jgi:hypothetical protein
MCLPGSPPALALAPDSSTPLSSPCCHLCLRLTLRLTCTTSLSSSCLRCLTPCLVASSIASYIFVVVVPVSLPLRIASSNVLVLVLPGFVSIVKSLCRRRARLLSQQPRGSISIIQRSSSSSCRATVSISIVQRLRRVMQGCCLLSPLDRARRLAGLLCFLSPLDRPTSCSSSCRADAGSFNENMAGWAKTVITGRARLGGVPLRVVCPEQPSVQCVIPPDPADESSSVRDDDPASWSPLDRSTSCSSSSEGRAAVGRSGGLEGSCFAGRAVRARREHLS